MDAGVRRHDPAFDQLVIATGSRILPERSRTSTTEAHHFYTAEAAARLRKALDAFTGGKIVIGIAGIPYKCPPAPLEVAFLIESELRERGLRDKTELTFLSPINRAFTIESVSRHGHADLRGEGDPTSSSSPAWTQIDAERKVVITDAIEEYPYDLLICVPPHKGAQVVIDSGLAPKSGWLPTDRATLQVKTMAARSGPRRRGHPALPEHLRARRRHGPAALEGRLDRPLRGADRRGARRGARVQGREPEGKDASYTGKVMCFFEVGDGKGTLLQFDYDHPPKPPKPNQLWHLGKIMFNKTYWRTVPKGRVWPSGPRRSAASAPRPPRRLPAPPDRWGHGPIQPARPELRRPSAAGPAPGARGSLLQWRA